MNYLFHFDPEITCGVKISTTLSSESDRWVQTPIPSTECTLGQLIDLYREEMSYITLVVNRNGKELQLPKKFKFRYGVTEGFVDRSDPRLIQWVQTHNDPDNGLECVKIPRDCSDFSINHNGDFETIIYVRKGAAYEI